MQEEAETFDVTLDDGTIRHIHIAYGDMVEYIQETASGELFLQQANAQGVMGSGIALQFKREIPQVFIDYKAKLAALAKAEKIPMGAVSVTFHAGNAIASIIGQDKYGRDDWVVYTDYAALRMGMAEIARDLSDDVIVNFPLIGCGFANGSWETVAKIIVETFPTQRLRLWILQHQG